MINRIICSMLFVLMILNMSVYANDFSSATTIKNIGDKKCKAVRLTPEVYNNTNTNLSDIIIKDKDNETVPYFINSFTENNVETKKTYELKLINSFVKDDSYYEDYTLKSHQQNDVIATSIKFNTDNSAFAKQIEIFGGYDNINWEKVKDDYIYKVEKNSKLEVMLNSCKYTYYRFKISNNLEKLFLKSVVLNYDNIVYNKENFMETISPKFTTEEQDKTTIVKLYNLKNIKLDSITIGTDSIFKREVSFDNGYSKTLYNLNFKNINYKDLTIPLDSYTVNSDVVELKVQNFDDKPIKISNIIVKYYVDELIFDGSKGGNFTLNFGNKAAVKPSFDIENYKEYILKEGYDRLNITDLKINLVKQPKQEYNYDYKYIFNIVITLVAVVLGIIILRKLKNI